MEPVRNLNTYYQSTPASLIEETLKLQQGVLSNSGALVINTGIFTGRSPRDKYILKDEVTINTVNWNDNNFINEECFDIAYKSVVSHLNNAKELWIQDCFACADLDYRLNIRVSTEKPWVALFVHNMFIRPGKIHLVNFEPEWQVFSAPTLLLDAENCGIRQSNATIISFKHKIILIAGTGYTGEIKKGIFTILNYILPMQKNVLSMHCSANMGMNKETAIFFGLSGTGKTTLSADPGRTLIGDDEHGWSENNIFNFEGGCYAKCINLSKENEPSIFEAIRPGALLENTVFYPDSDVIDFTDASVTENTRVSYPLSYIRNSIEPSIGKIPNNIFFLTCDAYGVLPPISKLNVHQAMYQFISGYTAKVAGTEAGISEPIPTFSACFGAPFLPLHPAKYAEMFGEKIVENNVSVWLVNTGWTGGPYGIGHRIQLNYTRCMISAALEGTLKDIKTTKDPVFKMEVPTECPGVPTGILNPRNTWNNKDCYDEKLDFLANLFVDNFEKYVTEVSTDILDAAPNVLKRSVIT